MIDLGHQRLRDDTIWAIGRALIKDVVFTVISAISYPLIVAVPFVVVLQLIVNNLWFLLRCICMDLHLFL